MSGEDSGESKTEEASTSKLRKQRDKGQFLKSQNFPAHLKYCVGIGFIYGFFEIMLSEFEQYFMKLSELIGRDIPRMDILVLLDLNMLWTAYISLFIVILIATALLAHGIYSSGFPIAFELIKFKFDNINPGKGLKRLFGRRQQTETWLGIVQLTIWLSLSLAIIYWFFEPMLSSITCGLGCIYQTTSDLFFLLIALSLFISVIIIVFDLLIQQSLFNHEMKMTKSEMTRDQKESYGDPKIKQEIRKRGHQMIFNDDGDTKDGLITEHKSVDNNTFVLVGNKSIVAIRFSRDDENPIPIVVASSSVADGNDIIESAKTKNTKVLEGELLADQIGSNVLPGSILEEVHFANVAAIIRREKLT